MKRQVIPELLDTDSGTPDQVRDSLADLQWLNRNFGGVTTTAQLLRRVADRTGSREFSFLDLAGASGDVAAGARAKLQNEGIKIHFTVLDRSFSHLPERRNGNVEGAIVGDALQIPFADNSFDVVGSALFIHHLEPEQIVAVIHESLRVCRFACIINDLHRSHFHLLSAYAGRLLYQSPITAHDAVASVRRAYTPEELKEILHGICEEPMEFSEHYFCRMGAILWKERSAQ